PVLQSALRLYDRVIVPHDEADDAPVPEGIATIPVGPILIRDRDELPTREEARRRLGLPEDGTVVYASFGGGGDPEADRCLRLLRRAVGAGDDLHVVLAPGPLFRGRGAATSPRSAVLVDELGRRASTLAHFPAVEMYPAFDVAVAGVGYNTSH